MKNYAILKKGNSGHGFLWVLVILFGLVCLAEYLYLTHNPQGTLYGSGKTASSTAALATTTPINSSASYVAKANGICGINVTSVDSNDAVSFPLTLSGTIDNSYSTDLGCSWQMYEGQAGTAQVFANLKNAGLTAIGPVAKVPVADWTATSTTFTTTVSLTDASSTASTTGLTTGTPVDVIFTAENSSGNSFTTVTYDLPLVVK